MIARKYPSSLHPACPLICPSGSNYVQQATSEKRRAAAPRNRRIVPTSDRYTATLLPALSASPPPSSDNRASRPSNLTPTTTLPVVPNMGNQFIGRTIPNAFPTDPYAQQSTPTAQLLSYLFSPPIPDQAPAPPPINGSATRPAYYEFVGSTGQLQPDTLQDWGEFAKDFLSETFRSEYVPAPPKQPLQKPTDVPLASPPTLSKSISKYVRLVVMASRYRDGYCPCPRTLSDSNTKVTHACRSWTQKTSVSVYRHSSQRAVDSSLTQTPTSPRFPTHFWLPSSRGEPSFPSTPTSSSTATRTVA